MRKIAVVAGLIGILSWTLFEGGVLATMASNIERSGAPGAACGVQSRGEPLCPLC